ncbi:MAG TPA: replication-associated recombination protein A [Candidatus Paceibacterota bacterium]
MVKKGSKSIQNGEERDFDSDGGKAIEPLASRIRPLSLDTYVGQSHLIGEGKPLRIAIEKGHIFSFILWGPPGVGKTTLARIYANAVDADMYELSAVSAGKDEMRSIIEGEKADRGLKKKSLFDQSQAEGDARIAELSGKKITGPRPKILFIDEIHRFNKSQQDFLLPYVESGAITLIGATTENPSFEVISALLSRCRVFTLTELNESEMLKIIDRALKDKKGRRAALKMDKKAKDWLISMANGDARQALAMIEATERLYDTVTVDSLKETLQSKFLRYDKKGEEHYNTISAFIKSMRASQPDAALYYLARMLDAGEDPKFVARRMVIFASEDIGLAVPTALVVANEVFRAVETIGLPECRLSLAHGVAYLATCSKSRAVYDGIGAAMEDVKIHGNLPIPLKIRNAPTKLMKELDYGKGYEKYTKDDLLPEKLKGKKYLL